MAKDYTARKQSGWKVVSLAPDVCKTPMGSSVPPVPYPVIAKLQQTVQPTSTVRVNSHYVVLFDASKTPKTIGDAPGRANGIKSGTVEADCWPKTRSSTVRFEGRRIIRHDDVFWMNGRHKGSPSSKGPWTKECIIRIFCPQDKDKIDLLAKTTLKSSKSITFMDQEFDGKAWRSKPFHAGGSSSSAAKEIGVLDGDSCEGAAQTFYHELTHQQQRGMSWNDAEIDAYTRTEQWAIDKGFQGRPKLRTTDASGKTIPNTKAISDFVTAEYPLGIEEIIASGADAGKVKLTDGTIRAPQKGDVVPGPPDVKGQRTVKTSDWKCP
ncbi:DUF4150 domain-containing protein [Lysobacter sp. Root690]|uniref:DUF4150 domain-containing protein n=1 Tax=Lysobacter sp. Root690 TaxID=1736588 RepID=UPI0009E6E23C|nr:DUF4150 domain-containing protein [Lysobacter sp. Root690]